MSDLIRKATVEKGHDPRNFVLFAFGGAAPVHASRYAAELGDSASGYSSDRLRSRGHRTDQLRCRLRIWQVRSCGVAGRCRRDVNDNFCRPFSSARTTIFAPRDFCKSDIQVMRSVDMRYRYQVHELNVPFPPGSPHDHRTRYGRISRALFDDLYEKAFGQGSGYREAGKEILTFRLTATGVLKKPDVKAEPASKPDGARRAQRQARCLLRRRSKVRSDASIRFRQDGSGNGIRGPAIIETPVTTVVVNPGDRAAMDEYRNIRIDIGA